MTAHTDHPWGVDADGLVDRSIICRSCGYDLIQIAADGDCPECSAPVDESLIPNDLRHDEPKHLRRFHRAFRVMSIGGWLLLSAVGAMMVGPMLFSPLGTWGFGLVAFSTGGLVIVGLLVQPIGWWMISKPAPIRASDPDAQRLASAIRLSMLAMPVMLVIESSLNVTGKVLLPVPPGTLLLLAGYVPFVLHMQRVRVLAGRAGIARSRTSARQQQFLPPVCYILINNPLFGPPRFDPIALGGAMLVLVFLIQFTALMSTMKTTTGRYLQEAMAAR